MTNPRATDAELIIAAARNLTPQIDTLRSEIERERRLPSSLVETMRSAHLFGLWLPRKFGGRELHPVDFVRTIEALSCADGSVGWCVTLANVYGLLAGSLSEAAADEIFGNHEIVAGTINPTGTAVAVDGGYRVTGRWAYGSGIDHSSWVLGNCIIHDGSTPRRTSSGAPDMRFIFFPRSDVEIIDTWHVGGMRGTGSHDFRVDDLFVPKDRSIPAFVSLGTQPGTLFRMPLLSLFVVALAAVTLGIARAALDALYELAGAKTPMGSAMLLREKPVAQFSAARAESLVQAARAFVIDAVGKQWDDVAAGEQPSLQKRASVRLACTYAGEACVKAVDLVYHTAGGSALYDSNRFERCLRDVHAATQHIGLTTNNYELAGRVLFGIDPGTPRF
jgi:indole-3-acetate monooxygenase